MRIFTPSEQELFEQLVCLKQPVLLKACKNYLQRIGYKNVIATKDYVVAEGEIPIVLSAHLDTVFSEPPKAQDIFYDRKKNVMWSPSGLGADDRAGVFAIFTLLRRGLRPHIVFTTDEELGCLGAEALVTRECPFKDIRYIIQIDRRGSNDCVFYDLDYPEFEKYIESFGFVTAPGSFTDIVVLCPAWKVAGVNLSTGYYNEHSVAEILRPNQLMVTIDKIEKMLRAENTVHWKYISYKKTPHSLWNIAYGMGPLEDDTEIVNCTGCGKEFFEVETYPVKDFDTGTIEHFCIDCLCQYAHWCNCCSEPYIATANYNHKDICPACYAAEGEENGSERNNSERQNNKEDS